MDLFLFCGSDPSVRAAQALVDRRKTLCLLGSEAVWSPKGERGAGIIFDPDNPAQLSSQSEPLLCSGEPPSRRFDFGFLLTLLFLSCRPVRETTSHEYLFIFPLWPHFSLILIPTWRRRGFSPRKRVNRHEQRVVGTAQLSAALSRFISRFSVFLLCFVSFLHGPSSCSSRNRFCRLWLPPSPSPEENEGQRRRKYGKKGAPGMKNDTGGHLVALCCHEFASQAD